MGQRPVKMLVWLVCLLLTSSAFAQTYYVENFNNGGRNTNNGTSPSTPVESIQRAHDLAPAGATILVGPGTYREQVNITKNNLIFKPRIAATPSNVLINGTDLIGNPSNNGGLWTLASGTTYKIATTGTPWRDLYSPRDIMTNDYYYDFGDTDPTHKGFGENQLFLNNTMMQQLRWPHNTSTDVAMPTMARIKSVIAEVPSTSTSRGSSTVEVDGFNGDTRWIGAYIFINTGHNSADGNGEVRKVLNVGPNSITFDYYRAGREGPFTIGGPNAEGGLGTELYLFNPDPARLPNDSDVNALLGPGEWYKKGTTLYVKIDNAGSVPNSTLARNVNAKTRYFAFAGNGIASGYTIDGFNLFACSVATFTGQEDETYRTLTSDCHSVVFNNLNITYVSHQVLTQDAQQGHNGWTGIVLNGRDHTVSNCTINYSATSAISLQGDRHKCFGNKIYDTNYMVSNASAINCGRRGWSNDLKIYDNIISNTTYAGIYMANLRNSDVNVRGLARISGNTIVNFMRRAGDSGAIDIAGTDLQWGRIDHNYIYNTNGRDETYEGAQMFGVYLDFGASGTGLIRVVIDHNVITNLMIPVIINQGTDVELFNNVLIGNGKTNVSANANYSVANGAAEGSGRNVRIFNNIMSHPKAPNLSGGSLNDATYTKNIDDATIETLSGTGKYAGIFVAPKFTGTSRSITDFKLSGSQISKDKAIDKGDLTLYNGANVNGLDVVEDLPDLGAFEWGTLMSTGNLGFENDFTGWTTYGTATINTTAANVRFGAKSGYFSNGGANYVLTGLTANTTYSLKAWVKAVSGTDIWVIANNFGGGNPGQKMTATSWTQTGDIVFKTGANNTSVTLSAWTGNGSAAYFDAFTVVPYTPTVTADRTDNPGTGKITARGDYAGNRIDAFDNNSSTSWLDSSPTSWIQFEFDNSAKYAVSSYTITSNPYSRHYDAKDWKLYGTNTPGVAFPTGYTELNSQSGVIFTASEKKTFTISNTTGYRAYRLEITANSGGGNLQIGEIELFAPASCSTCRSSAEVESQLTEVFTLKLHPNPASREVMVDLSGFAGESAVQVKMSDMTGKSFLGQQVQLREGVKQVILPVNHLPQGLFFVTVQGSKTTKTAKLVITK